MNTHGQAVDSRGRVHVVMWHCTAESLAAAGSEPGEHRWGPPAARRYHHYWRDERGAWHHVELPGVAGSRPKVLVDRDDNAYLIYRRGDQYHRVGPLVIAAASASSRWTDWRVIHAEPGPFVNEMLGDAARFADSGILSIVVQEAPARPRQPTALRVLDFAVEQRRR